MEKAWLALRMTPVSRLSSTASKRRSWEKATCVGTPPGAAVKKSWTVLLVVRLMSQRSSASAMDSAWTQPTDVSRRPARSSSPRMPMMPPARWTSSMWTLAIAGATLQSTGTRRDSRSMSAMVKSTSPSWAAARRCSTVLVEPPMAMSSVMAFSKAAKVAIERGRTPSSSCS